MRVLALDVGEKRIGVSLGETEVSFASPLTTIPRTSEPNDIDAVLRLVAEHDAAEIVVGLPRSLSGRMGPQAMQVSRFADELSRRASVPVKTVDERYSTVEAEKLLRQAGAEPSKDRARVDAAAATVILQSYLESKRLRSSS